MKKVVKKLFGSICTFILGTQSKIFAIEQTDVYGPPPEPKNFKNITSTSQTAVYGPPPESGISELTGGHIFSIIASILIFIVGLIVILNKNIKKKTKVIIVTLLAIALIALLLLAIFVG